MHDGVMTQDSVPFDLLPLIEVDDRGGRKRSLTTRVKEEMVFEEVVDRVGKRVCAFEHAIETTREGSPRLQ